MPKPSDTHSLADYSECAVLQARMMQAVGRLSSMVGNVAASRQIREFDGDRRKAALAHAALPFLNAGESSAAAETKGRASQAYADSMKQLAAQLTAAEKTIAEWDATRIEIECSRSLLAMQRDSMKNL